MARCNHNGLAFWVIPLVGVVACGADDPSPRGAREPIRDLMVVGLDEKVTWNDQGVVLSEGGADRVLVYDIGDREAPRLVANLALSNSVFGPPVNLAFAPDQTLALVADSTVHVPSESGGWAFEPAEWTARQRSGKRAAPLARDDPCRAPALRSRRPLRRAARARRQPRQPRRERGRHRGPFGHRGRDRARRRRAGGGVAFTPDGSRALAVKFQDRGKVASFDIAGDRVSYRGAEADVDVGPWPYNIAITPDGRLALTADNDANGASDGVVDSVTVLDLEADPPARLARVEVGDGPEGLAISPTGELAVVAIIDGSNAPSSAPFRNSNGTVVALSIAGREVRVVGDPVGVGALPEGVVFSPDGDYVYVGNYLSRTISILKVSDGQVVNTGQVVSTPGQPGSMR